MTRARLFAAAALVAAACVSPGPGRADVAIVQVYSSPDGEYQAILLEDDVDDGVDRFRGLTLVMQDATGVSHLHTLGVRRIRENALVVEGRRRFLVATPLLATWLRAQAELPEAFVDTAGGTISIFGAPSSLRQYPLLDDGGAVAFDRASGRAAYSNFELAVHPKASDDSAATKDFFAQPLPAVLVREYVSSDGQRYRLAVLQQEKADLDIGRDAGWRRTGRVFRTIDASHPAAPLAVPVCRYYLPPPHGDTRFYTAHAEECAALARAMPAAVLESHDAFRVALPDAATGTCTAPSLRPLYRSWNGQPQASHRYTADVGEHVGMLSLGWIGEGHGALGVAMCVDAFEMPAIAVPKLKPRIRQCADC